MSTPAASYDETFLSKDEKSMILQQTLSPYLKDLKELLEKEGNSVIETIILTRISKNFKFQLSSRLVRNLKFE